MRVAGFQALVIRFALRFRGIVVALSSLLAAYGIYTLAYASYDVFPEFAPPQVSVQTEAPGLSPEQVEALVTRPVETAINGVSNLQRMVSTSIQGLSVVTVYFDTSTDPYRNRQLVAERLATVSGQLPTGVQSPTMTPLTSSAELVLVIGITSSSQSQMRLRTIAQWTIRPALLSVPGVASVEIFGGESRALQVLVHPDRLIQFGLSVNDIIAAARNATGVRGAGFVSTSNQRIVLQTQGQSLEPQDIARTVLVRRDGASVTLGDVADVVDAPEPAIGAASIMGQPGVVINVTEQYRANTLDVTKGVESALADLRPVLTRDDVILHEKLFRPANFITAATDNLRSALVIGGILIAIVLFLFLFDLRAAAICCTAIPLSLLAAVVVLQHVGITLNTMTLGALAIALGEVVDDAVIGVENAIRRLRENRRSSDPRPPTLVVLDATFEVRGAVVYATFAVILVFLPVVTLSGVAGNLFGPLGIAYVLAVLVSLIVAVTVTPALALLVLPQHASEREPPLVRWMKRLYEATLMRVAQAPRLTIASVVVLTGGAVSLLPLFGATFLPELKEGHFTLHMTAMPGTSLDESLRMGSRITAILMKLPIVRSVAQRAGRAELTVDTHGPHHSEFEVDLKSVPESYGDTVKFNLLKALTDVPGPTFAANTFLTERINETLSGYAAPVAVEVYGNDFKRIDDAAQKTAEVLRGVRGAVSVAMQSPLGLPLITVTLKRSDLDRWGFDPVEVLDVIRTAYQGDAVGQIYEGNQVFNVVVKLAPRAAGNIAEIGNLPLKGRDGTYVPLKQLADIRVTSGLYQIEHLGGRRVQTITLDVEGRDLASFVQDAQRQIAEKVKLPSGIYVEFAGAAQGAARAERDLTLKGLLAGIGIVILVSVVTRNWRNLLVVFANLPFAFVGGVIVALLAGGVLSLGSLIGFVTLFGITLRNSMMMISHYEYLVETDGMPWGVETAIRGAADRLAPIVMTSLVTGLGLLPLAVGTEAPGREIEGPMALVILGGLVTSMVLNLLVLPTLALRYGRFELQERIAGL